MADLEHLEILKQGVEVWNRWRKENPKAKVDLRGALLSSSDLQGFNLKHADLEGAEAISAKLAGASLRRSRLVGIDLRRASLRDADLWMADLREANLWGAYLRRTNLCAAVLDGTYVRVASMGSTQLGDLDLRETKSLEGIRHLGPSSIGTDTIVKSKGEIPEEFLRGCGLSDWEIEAAKLHNSDLTSEQVIDVTYEIARLKAESPIQINPLFISYSHVNTSFVETLEKRFDEKRICYWRDVHDMKAGRMETQIERAIRHNPIVLLVLSEASVESDWVEWEVSKAREFEKQEKRDVLCPVALDDAWKTCPWGGPLRRQVEKYNILDFSDWEDDAVTKRQFQKLIDGLGMFYPTAG